MARTNSFNAYKNLDGTGTQVEAPATAIASVTVAGEAAPAVGDKEDYNAVVSYTLAQGIGAETQDVQWSVTRTSGTGSVTITTSGLVDYSEAVSLDVYSVVALSYYDGSTTGALAVTIA